MSKMNDPQFWGLIRGILIAFGGIVASYGLVSVADWAVIVDKGVAVATAIAGLVAILWPMYQGWRARSTKQLAATAGDLPEVQAVVMTSDSAAKAVPSAKVVGPGTLSRQA